ncbi:MAG: hypothetical protein JST68_14895 [Bacteroidetes bacterium]|nr:hypothetical protein [Bacteroidota bacterium]
MKSSILPYAHILIPTLLTLIALYGFYLLIRNIILINKGISVYAVVYTEQSSYHTETKVKFWIGDQLIDIPLNGTFSNDMDTGSRETSILYYPNHPKIHVEETPQSLYLPPAVFLFIGLSSLFITF